MVGMDTMTDTPTENLSVELDAFLACGFDGPWLVERTLKRSPHEVTELVRRRDAGSSPERFVRKRIDCARGLGSAYGELLRAERGGAALPCVPRIVSCERSDGIITVVMEYIEGDALDRFAVAFGPGEDLARLVMPALADAVSCLHERLDAPLIHRDLKPQNVIVRGGAPVIIDFGIARSWREGAQSDTAHFLTRPYAPPEQFGFGQTDERSDVYALGKLLFFCLTGETPPVTCDAGTCSRAGISAGCAEAIARACAFDPAARFQSARAFSVAARDALGAAPGAAPHPAPAARPAVPAPSGPAPALFMEPAPPSASGDALSTRGPARSLAQARRSARAIADRVPRWLGRAWNAAVLAAWALLVSACAIAVASPNPHDAALPTWFLVLEYLGMCALDFTVMAYLLLDRRRLRRRFPALSRRGVLAEAGIGAAVVAASIAVTVAAGMASGAI